MFEGSTSTEYEDIVNKTTDENLTSENWELILNLCDKVQDEGQPGAHAAIAAILKRLAHRNPNVQLYALSLAEALSKNLGIEIHRELASRAFTQGIEKLITDRNTHEKVRRRALGLVAAWTVEFEKDTSLGIMEDCYNSLKAKNYKFEQPEEPAPPTVDDEIRRKEEEELQRVLEMSMQDRGGRPQWTAYSLANGSSSSGSTPAATSSSATAPVSGVGLGRSGSSSAAAASSSSSSHPFAQPKYQAGGYVPARTPSPATVAAQQRRQQQEYEQAQALQRQQQHQQQQLQSTTTISSSSTNAAAASTTASTSTPASTMASGAIVTRVRALHTFEPTEPGELAFEQGDIIKVVDRGYKDWWRGQLKGRTGIFPVNYVEPMPEPTAAELAREAEQEAAVFAQAVNVEKLLNMLRALDPAKDSLADNEEIQELYRSSMALRPKIVKLIDKYSQKRADLVSMNETFVRARTIFDRMMEESLARHTGVYDQPSYRGVPPQYGPRTDSGATAGRRPEYGQQATSYGGWGNASTPYGAYPPAQNQGAGAYGMVPVAQAAPGSEVRGASPYPTQGYVDPTVAAGYAQPQQVQAGYGVLPQGGYAGQQPGAPYTQQGPVPYPVQQQQQQPQQATLQQQPVQQTLQQQQPVQQPPQQQQPVQQVPQQQQHVHQQPQQHLPQQQQQVYQQPTQSQPIQAEPVHYQAQSQSQPQQANQQPNIQSQAQVQPELTQGHVTQATSPGASSAGTTATTSVSSPQPQTQSPPQQPISGPPPYVYDPSYTYADPNVQAWAQYYAQGGKDLTGSVYFISIPGLTDASNTSVAAASPAVGAQQSQQQLEAQGQGQVLQHQQPQQTDQGLYSAQAQAHAQQQQQQPLESGLAYNTTPAAAAAPNSSLASSGPAPGASSPSYQQQEQQYSGPRYQLQDQQPLVQTPAQGQTPAQTQYAQYPATYDNAPRQNSPTTTSAVARPTSATGSYHSPTQQTSTPSWVLPKKTPGTTPGPGAATASGGDAYFPVVNQFKGISLSDSGPGASGGI